ncbi:hypothetical protein [Streptomyces rimosus]|uniref:hypothetical protein n=1 Tax=Streptomyces rimosus TaxID=1927 RepID=UPI0006B2A049|nr:hypothetical protein [Streptomyces rimosus]KOT98865.1 hypothetical protein ADK70_05790 [Streptomyces rimosus subsp. pseudoverticillatus]
MAVRRRTASRRSTTTTAVALATAALAASLLTACGTVEKAVGCAKIATTFANDLDQLRQDLSNAADSPQNAQRAVDRLNKDLGKIQKSTDDPDVQKALTDLTKALDKADDAVRDGKAPDLDGLKDAAGSLTKTCTPG